jgi:hypothetical protein
MSIVDFTLYIPAEQPKVTAYDMLAYLSEMNARFVAFQTFDTEPTIHDMNKKIDYTGEIGFEEFKKKFPIKK